MHTVTHRHVQEQGRQIKFKAYNDVSVYCSHLGVFNASAVTDVPQAHFPETAHLSTDVNWSTSQVQWLHEQNH